MTDSLAGVALAAGAGRRLRPLTDARPKPLCPVGGVPLLDLALERLATVGADPVVNLHHEGAVIAAHLDQREGAVHRSWEPDEALGTAGALGRLRRWIDGRATVIVNTDGWCPGPLTALVDGWDGERVRILVPGGGPFGGRSLIAGALMPWSDVRDLPARPSGLYEMSWRAANEEGRLEVVAHHGPFVDCGTTAAYLAANLAASGGVAVVDPGAEVEGRVTRSVVWSDGRVEADEHLVDAIRFSGRRTVLVR